MELIEYNEGLKPLEELLREIDRPGDYCTHGSLCVPMPLLRIDGVGTISFPVPAVQAEALVATAERAPYGKGARTLVDSKVRNCWQVDPKRVHPGGRTWAETFGRILELATEGLGCPGLRAELYKLLVYEPGGFFVSHRDTEKEDGMVATLVVAFPAAGSGGDLVIRHQGRETVVDMNLSEPSELAYAAFYADCEHEILPVTEGYRICLVYNLVLTESESFGAPDYEPQVAALASVLSDWSRDPERSKKIVWLLEHDYSAAGLSFETLKNMDAAVARVLGEAAERAGCATYAALVHTEETGSAESYGYDSWDSESEDDADFEVVEVVEVANWLDGWAAPGGGRPDYGNVPVLDGELMPVGGLDDAEPDQQRLHEATGNGGASYERSYLHAALVVWPRAETLDVLVQGGIAGAMEFVAGEAGGSGPARALAVRLVDLWPQKKWRDSQWHANCSRGIELLHSIGDAVLLSRFLREVLLPDYDPGVNDALVAASTGLDPESMREFLSGLASEHFGRSSAGILDLTWRLCERLAGDEPWDGIFRATARAACESLPLALTREKPDRSAWSVPDRQRLGAEGVRDLFRLAWRFGLEGLADEAAEMIAARPEEVSPDRELPQALERLKNLPGGGGAYEILWRRAADFLLARSETPPTSPSDWTISGNVGCKCEHCKELKAFCRDPVAMVHRFSVRGDLRGHLMARIDENRLDIDYEEEEQGRPYKLKCTKNRASFERRLEEYAEDVEEMRRLVAAAAKESPDRLQAAVDRAE